MCLFACFNVMNFPQTVLVSIQTGCWFRPGPTQWTPSLIYMHWSVLIGIDFLQLVLIIKQLSAFSFLPCGSNHSLTAADQMLLTDGNQVSSLSPSSIALPLARPSLSLSLPWSHPLWLPTHSSAFSLYSFTLCYQECVWVCWMFSHMMEQRGPLEMTERLRPVQNRLGPSGPLTEPACGSLETCRMKWDPTTWSL